MTNVCPSCGSEQSMAWLCSDCCTAIETMLAAAPALIAQLDIAISKQVKLNGGGSRPRTADKEDDGNDAGLPHTRSPVNWGAVSVRDSLLVELALWGDDIDVIRRHPKAAEIAIGIGGAVKNAYRAIDRMQDRKYLGKCMNQIGGLKCQEELWVAPHAKEVRCKSCQYEHNVANRRLDMLDMAEDLICTPREASQYIGEVGGITVGHQRIRNYLDRKRVPERPSPDGVKRLRLGDLLEVLRGDVARRDAQAS
jgi:hypothetical protein